jgi:glyoxylase-like metal-dependent hydrolase (beta-lactamase superfamily II)
MRIEKLVVPTPFPVGPINLYLIVDDPLTLVDTGPKTEEARAALEAELARVGFRCRDLRRIILTHTHEDHCGLAGMLQRESGATVHVHEWETANLTGRGMTRANRALLARAGVPAADLEEIAARYERIHQYAEVVSELIPYRDQEEFGFAGGALRVVHTPGHTPGSACLLREANRLVLTGDTILKSITPNPVLNPDPIDPARRFPSLGEYLVSLARLRALAPTLLKTSHGDDVTDYEEHFNRLLRHVRERQARVIGLVPKEGVTAWAVAARLFPGVRDVHRFLAVSEAVAHLDLAVADQRLRIETRDEVERYCPL